MKCQGPCGRRRRRWECNVEGICLDCATKVADAARVARTIAAQSRASAALEEAHRAQLAEHARDAAATFFDR